MDSENMELVEAVVFLYCTRFTVGFSAVFDHVASCLSPE